MQYQSTRGGDETLSFEEVTLAGLAPDGGLYLPTEWPRFSEAEIADMAGLPYAQLAQRVMQPFVGDSLTPERLLELCEQAYGRFAHDAVTPLVQLDEQHWLLELFHGPTLAFKDVALQLLGLLFEEFLARTGDQLTIVGATSGDTGSAAIDAVAGRERVDIFMLHPEGRVSDVQRRQMTTVNAPNVFNIAIDGSFDDAQASVKRMFNDAAVTQRFNIGAVNSINWARLMAQVVYYFAAALQLGAPQRKVAFLYQPGISGMYLRAMSRRKWAFRLKSWSLRRISMIFSTAHCPMVIIQLARLRQPLPLRWIFRSVPTLNACCSIWAAATAQRWPRK